MKRSGEPVAAEESLAKSATTKGVTRKGSGKKSPSASILAAARALLDREGIAAVAMRTVAEQVGVTPMAIYRHFADRESLLNAVAESGFEELAGRVRGVKREGGMENQLMTVGKAFLEAALEFPHLYELIFLAPRKGARVYPDGFHAGRSPTFRPMVEILEEAKREEELREDNAEEIALELSAMTHGLIVLYLGGRVAQSEAEFRSLYQRSFWRYFDGLRR